MSPITKKKALLVASLGAYMVLFGCSTPNSDSLIDPDTGKHAANWMSGSPSVHAVVAEKDFNVCKECHGQNYRNGMAVVSCYDCHNGPGLNHPNPGWVVPLSPTSTKPYHKTDPAVCTKCHGADYLGGGSHIACINCHMEDHTKVHILAWYPDVESNHQDYARNNGTLLCQSGFCHGLPTLTADVWNGLSGPHCNGTCHGWPP